MSRKHPSPMVSRNAEVSFFRLVKLKLNGQIRYSR